MRKRERAEKRGVPGGGEGGGEATEREITKAPGSHSLHIQNLSSPGTVVENGKKHRQNSHLIIHCPTSEGVSKVSERANGRASGPVLQSVFLAVFDHSALGR